MPSDSTACDCEEIISDRTGCAPSIGRQVPPARPQWSINLRSQPHTKTRDFRRVVDRSDSPATGATRLSHLEPHPVDARQSLRAYVCQACESLQTRAVIKRVMAELDLFPVAK